MRGTTYKIFKYTLSDLLRSRWILGYALLFAAVSGGILYLGDQPTQAVVSVLNLVILVVPLVSLVLGLMYHYANRDFALLVLTQPVHRASVFRGQYLGLSLALVLAYLVGAGVPFLLYAIGNPVDWAQVGLVLLAGTLVSLVFTALALYIGVAHDERVRALGLAIGIWFSLTMIYDSLLLLFIILAEAYPIDPWVIGLSMVNPVDLARVMVLLKLDTAALMGYTGAVFNKFLGSNLGLLLAVLALLFWIVVPAWRAQRVFSRRDF